MYHVGDRMGVPPGEQKKYTMGEIGQDSRQESQKLYHGGYCVGLPVTNLYIILLFFQYLIHF